MKLIEKLLRKIILFPIFALLGIPDGGAGDGVGDNEGDDKGDGGKGNPNGDEGNQNPDSGDKLPKTMKELQSLMKQEKNSGRQSAMKELLKELGVEDVKNVKEGWAKYKEYLDSQKTNEQKLTDSLKDATGKLTASEQRAQFAERQLALIKLGCKADCVEDAAALAGLKVNDKVDFDTAAKELKEKHPSFFGEEDGLKDNGTGGLKKNGKSVFTTNGLGERLAASKAAAFSNKNPYFKD